MDFTAIRYKYVLEIVQKAYENSLNSQGLISSYIRDGGVSPTDLNKGHTLLPVTSATKVCLYVVLVLTIEYLGADSDAVHLPAILQSDLYDVDLFSMRSWNDLRSMSEIQTIGITNQKGGVAKSTNTINLAGALA
jgi:hypothetical protein